MLVITRKRNQAIVVGDGIEIRVLRIGRDGVRIGVTAPSHVRVHRQEIYEMVCAANLSAAEMRPAAVEQAARKLRARLRPSTLARPFAPSSGEVSPKRPSAAGADTSRPLPD